MKKLFVGVLVAVAAFSSAATFSSFNAVTLTGVSSNLTGLQLTTNLSVGATMTFNNVTYSITDLFGHWLIAANPTTLSGTNGVGNSWGFDTSDSGGGKIRGWVTNPNSGITPGGSVSHNFATQSGSFDNFGYHVRVDATIPETGGNTLFVYHNPVPEPTTIAALGMGAVALISRRRRNRK